VADTEAEDRSDGVDHRQWRISIEPVPSSRWVAIEAKCGVTPGACWEPINPSLWR
jgi:hypothetical protein